MNKLLKVVPARLQIAIAICASLSFTGATASDAEFEQATQPSENFSHAKVPMTFRNGDTHLRVVDNINGLAVSEGDIILGESDDFFSRSNQRATLGLSNHVYGTVWPNGLVPYNISNELSAAGVAKIRSAIQRWNDTGAITLVERTATTAAAYPNYINFIKADQCASWVGFQNTGPQSIYAGDKCSEGSMVHEIGHALGLLHEHTRPDRDNHVQINWNNIHTDKAHNFDILDDAILLGEYDLNSIMHYGSHFFSQNGQATLTPLHDTNAQIGQREYISDGDAQSVKQLYASELAVASSAPNNAQLSDTIELELYVTNNTDMGANRLTLLTAVPASAKLVSFSSANWICQQAGTGQDIVCTAPVLAKSASSSVSVSLTSETGGLISFDTTLSSNTFDTNLSNNNDRVTVTTPAAQSNDAKDTAVPSLAATTAPVTQATDTQATETQATDTQATDTQAIVSQATVTKAEPTIAAAQAEPTIAAAQPAPTVNAAQPATTTTPVGTTTASAGGGGAFGALGLLPFFLRRKSLKSTAA